MSDIFTIQQWIGYIAIMFILTAAGIASYRNNRKERNKPSPWRKYLNK